MKHSKFRYQSGLWLFAVLLAFQLGCASTTPQEQAREVLREAADAMGGLEALGPSKTSVVKDSLSGRRWGRDPSPQTGRNWEDPVPSNS